MNFLDSCLTSAKSGHRPDFEGCEAATWPQTSVYSEEHLSVRDCHVQMCCIHAPAQYASLSPTAHELRATGASQPLCLRCDWLGRDVGGGAHQSGVVLLVLVLVGLRGPVAARLAALAAARRLQRLQLCTQRLRQIRGIDDDRPAPACNTGDSM